MNSLHSESEKTQMRSYSLRTPRESLKTTPILKNSISTPTKQTLKQTLPNRTKNPNINTQHKYAVSKLSKSLQAYHTLTKTDDRTTTAISRSWTAVWGFGDCELPKAKSN